MCACPVSSYNALDVLDSIIQSFPDHDAVLDQLNLLVAVPSVLPCLNALVDQVVAVNSSLFLLGPVSVFFPQNRSPAPVVF